MSGLMAIRLKVRRYDLKENPIAEDKIIKLNPKLDYGSLKRELQVALNLGTQEDKVIKVRNKDLVLVPITYLLEQNSKADSFIIDISKIQRSTRSNAHLQDAYLDAVRQKLHSMENRVTQAEMLIPQLQWKRQAHMEQTVHNLSTRVAFLNRRIDELTPAQWKAKLSVSAT